MEWKREKLKIGILINSYFIPSWQLKIINEIKSSSYSEIALIIINNTSAIYASPDFSNITCKKRKIIYNVHLKLDELILGRNTDYSRILDSTTLLKDVASIIVTPIEHGFTDQLNKNDIMEIKAFNLDIILKFGFKALSGDILQASKYGIWSYEPDKDVELLGYHEVVDKLQTTNSILQILEDGSNGGKIIHYSQMLTNYLSISKNRNACYWRISTVIPHIIEGLYKSGDAYLQRLENKYKTDIHFRKKAISKTTSSIKALKNIFKHFSKVSKRIHQKIFFNDHWDVFYKIDSRRLLPALQEFKI